MSPTDSNILPIYPVEEGEMEVIHSNSIPEEKLTPATVVQLREHSLKLVEASLIVEKIFTGDAALERANHFRKIFLQRMKMIYGKMKRAKDQRPIQSQILDNWALESLGDIVPMYVKYGHDGVPVFNETNFIETQTDSLLESKWKGLLDRIDGFWIEKNNFESHVMHNLLLVEGDRGSRQGFPPGVLQDINFLSGLHKKNFPDIYQPTLEDKQNGFATRADIKQWKLEDGTKLSLLP